MSRTLEHRRWPTVVRCVLAIALAAAGLVCFRLGAIASSPAFGRAAGGLQQGRSRDQDIRLATLEYVAGFQTSGKALSEDTLSQQMGWDEFRERLMAFCTSGPIANRWFISVTSSEGYLWLTRERIVYPDAPASWLPPLPLSPAFSLPGLAGESKERDLLAGPGYGQAELYRIHPWLFAPLLLAYPVVFLFRGLRRWRRRPPNQCRHCGYDLTGNTTGRCPECGTAVAGAMSESEQHDSKL